MASSFRGQMGREPAGDSLRESEERFRALFEEAPIAYHEIDTEGRIQRVNRAECELLGFSAEELLGKCAWDFVSPEEVEASHTAVVRKLSGEQPLHPFNRRFLRKDGAEVCVEIHESLIHDRAGNVMGIRSALLDITARKLAEEALLKSQKDLEERVGRRTAELAEALRALQESESTFRLLFANNPQPMWVYDFESLEFLEVNGAAIEHYGYTREEFLQMRVTDIRPPDDLTRFLTVLSSYPAGFRNAGEWKHRRKDGGNIEVQISAHRFDFRGKKAVLSVMLDVTERKLLENQLRQSQKMEAIGRLAGGVAHDFNNLLTIIIGYSQLILKGQAESDPSRSSLEQILGAAERATGLTNQLLAFSRRQIVQLEIVELNHVVKRTEKLLRRLIGEDIDLITELDEALPCVKVDCVQLEQVIMNLAVNSRDAMPEGGTLTLRTAAAELDAEYARTHVGVAAGRYVMLAVSDTGIGMDAATQSRIFDPFFTTKDIGRGTGLGLSTVYGIVRQHEGHIWVESERGAGTTFRIYLPVVERESATEPCGVAAEAGGGAETILVAEDDPSLRELICGMLKTRGYRVLEARDGAEALEVSTNHRGPIDLLLTDVVMPRMSGRVLFEHLMAMRRDMAVLFMSGYTDEAIVQHGVLDSNIAFLQKPFNPQDLAAKIREVLKT